MSNGSGDVNPDEADMDMGRRATQAAVLVRADVTRTCMLAVPTSTSADVPRHRTWAGHEYPRIDKNTTIPRQEKTAVRLDRGITERG